MYVCWEFTSVGYEAEHVKPGRKLGSLWSFVKFFVAGKEKRRRVDEQKKMATHELHPSVYLPHL
ncbi:hypothetical protein SAMN04487866_10745 [Thermoactinomyces sp. DSM 45891]|nr:hypothetical protein SAMN04487866_10745 [Thermoactinomyces sp. DSM 45891]